MNEWPQNRNDMPHSAQANGHGVSASAYPDGAQRTRPQADNPQGHPSRQAYRAPQVSPQAENRGHHGNGSNPGPDMDFLTGQRDVSAFLKANAHSGMVRRMRIVLPAVAVAMIVIIGGAWMLSGSSETDPFLVEAQVENGRMVMQNPELKGQDDQNRPYYVTARQAVQDATQPDLIQLSEISADVPMDDTTNAKIIAGNGLYNSKAKTLKLGGEVNVTTADGMSMTLQDADVDIDAGTLATQSPVSLTSIQARISANRLQVEDNGKRIILEDRVRMTIYPDKIKQDGSHKTATAN